MPGKSGDLETGRVDVGALTSENSRVGIPGNEQITY